MIPSMSVSLFDALSNINAMIYKTTAFSSVPDLDSPTTYPVLNPKARQGLPDCLSHIRSRMFPLQLTEVNKKFL